METVVCFAITTYFIQLNGRRDSAVGTIGAVGAVGAIGMGGMGGMGGALWR